MTDGQQAFESWKYSRRISLVYLGDSVFGLAGPDLRLLKVGTLGELAYPIQQLADQLEREPRKVTYTPPEEISLDYLTEIEL